MLQEDDSPDQSHLQTIAPTHVSHKVGEDFQEDLDDSNHQSPTRLSHVIENDYSSLGRSPNPIFLKLKGENNNTLQYTRNNNNIFFLFTFSILQNSWVKKVNKLSIIQQRGGSLEKRGHIPVKTIQLAFVTPSTANKGLTA